LSQGQHTLGPERKQAVFSIPAPKIHRQIREFLGAAGFCQIQIPNYSFLGKPLYEDTKTGEQKPMIWGKEQKRPVKKLRGHSQTPLLASCDETLLPLCT
jgi:hypothetical protein